MILNSLSILDSQLMVIHDLVTKIILQNGKNKYAQVSLALWNKIIARLLNLFLGVVRYLGIKFI